MRILVDTNILLRLADSAHGLHRVTIRAFEELKSQDHELLIAPQSIYEFWSVATRSLPSNGLGKPPSYAEKLIPTFLQMFRLLKDEGSLFDAWLELVAKHQITGVHSHDARLAAAMQVHGISHLLTFNAKDFREFPHISILEPGTVVKP